MKRKIIIVSIVIIIAALISLVLSFVVFGGCENDFKVYSKKGYCEFNLKICEGIFGCKEYEKVQVPCGSMSTLCGKKVLCDCGS